MTSGPFPPPWAWALAVCELVSKPNLSMWAVNFRSFGLKFIVLSDTAMSLATGFLQFVFKYRYSSFPG
eukprot:4984078-Prorocentrum_lima.AAC.1